VKRYLTLIIAVLVMMMLFGCGKKANAVKPEAQTKVESAVAETKAEVVADAEEKAETVAEKKTETATQNRIDESGSYYDVESVVLYLHTYGKLPSNYITKKEAQALGWEGGSVETVAPDKAIGGDHFGNYEGKLPEAAGREYTECDIDTHGYKSRGSRRLIFSNDGLYFYTGDHYENFDELYVTDEGEVKWK